MCENYILHTLLILKNFTIAKHHFWLFAHDELKCSGHVAAGGEEAVLMVGRWKSIEQAVLTFELHLSGWEPTCLPLTAPSPWW